MDARSWGLRGGALVLGAVLGGVAWLAVPREVGVGAPPVDAAGGAPAETLAAADCPPADTGARDRLEALRADRSALEFQERLLRGQVQLLGGLPVPWPEGVDPAVTEAELVPRLEALDAETPEVEVLDVDCAEFPCLILVETSGPDTASAGVSGRDGEAFAAALGVPGGVTSAKVGPDEARRAFSVIVAHPGPAEPLVAKRVERRTAEAMARGRELLAAPSGVP